MVEIEDFLTDELLLEAQAEVRKSLRQSNMTTNIFWEDAVRGNFLGLTLISKLSHQLKYKIHSFIIDKISELSEYKSFNYSFHILNHNCGIGWHNDKTYSRAVTIYLNEEWEWENGGLFLYKPKDKKDEVRAIKPVENKLVMVDDHEMHMVSNVSSTVTEPRYSIQIFFN